MLHSIETSLRSLRSSVVRLHFLTVREIQTLQKSVHHCHRLEPWGAEMQTNRINEQQPIGKYSQYKHLCGVKETQLGRRGS